jgi:hypothetical protein
MKLTDIIKGMPVKPGAVMHPRPYYNHSVSFKNTVSSEERAEMLRGDEHDR